MSILEHKMPLGIFSAGYPANLYKKNNRQKQPNWKSSLNLTFGAKSWMGHKNPNTLCAKIFETSTKCAFISVSVRRKAFFG
jgi:hypothetical protein